MRVVCNILAAIMLGVVFEAQARSDEAPEPLLLDGTSVHWSATPYLLMMREPSEPMTLEDAASPAAASDYIPVHGNYLNVGIVRRGYWFELPVRNPGSERQEYLLELSNPRLVSIEFYDGPPGSDPAVQQAGKHMAFEARSLLYARPVFSFQLEPGEERILYMRIYHRGSLRFDADIWKKQHYPLEASWRDLRDGTLYGSLMIMFVLQLILALAARARGYLLLAAFTGSVFFFFVAARGVGFQHLWPHQPDWAERSYMFFLGLAITSILLFARDYLRTYQHAKWWDRALLVCAALGIVLSGGRFITESLWVNYLSHYLTLIGAAVLVGAGFVTARHERNVLLFIVAWTALFAATIVYSIAVVGGYTYAFLMEYLFEGGFPVSLVLVSVSVWLRLHRQEREHRSQLEERVAERTSELQQALENVRTLHGLIPICSVCHKIRDDQGYWARLENYIQSHSDAEFTHSICPECAHLMYGDIVDDIGHS